MMSEFERLLFEMQLQLTGFQRGVLAAARADYDRTLMQRVWRVVKFTDLPVGQVERLLS